VTSLVHDRMPVIVQGDDYDLWLDPGMMNVEALSDLLKSFDARLMRSYCVSNRVNRVQYDDAECATAGERREPQQTRLFSKRTCQRTYSPTPRPLLCSSMKCWMDSRLCSPTYLNLIP
jgi:hypothetical protein